MEKNNLKNKYNIHHMNYFCERETAGIAAGNDNTIVCNDFCNVPDCKYTVPK